MLVWILTSWFMFCCQFCRTEYQYSIWAAKYFIQELSNWPYYWERGYLISSFYHLSSKSFQEIELTFCICSPELSSSLEASYCL